MEALAIETAGLTRRFGPVLAVDNVSLEVPSRSIYGFLGPNGAGKTTTIRLLLSLVRPDAGEIVILGAPIRSNREKLLRRIGSLVEAPALYLHLTGRENLRATQELVGYPKSQIQRVLDLVRLGPDAGRMVRGYSLGMRQRLGLALALLGGPELLILDEPTNGLDPAGIHEMRELIRGFPEQEGITVFLSSHLLAEVEQIATHVGIVGTGHLLFQGTLADLHGRQRTRLVLDVDGGPQAVRQLTEAGWPKSSADDDHTVTVQLLHRQESADVVSALVRGGLRVFQARFEQRSLEQIFLSLTSEHRIGGGKS